ncbi:MAG: hypothetical protein P4L67_00295 [Candidatus Pacebacteria bacterium]|nr:hypothetical protein [Candidatus Paceibacterota bacterium]
MNSLYIFNSTAKLNNSLDEAKTHKSLAGGKMKKVETRRTSEESRKGRSLKFKKLGKERLSGTFAHEIGIVDEEDSDAGYRAENRGEYIKQLLHTLSHQTINEEDEMARRKPAKKQKKELLTEMDYRIMSIYKAPLPTSKPLKRKKNSFNLGPVNE